MFKTTRGLLLTLLLCACAAPFTTSQLDTTQSYQQSNRSALAGDTPSNDTLIILRRHGLLKQWQRDPASAIAVLRAQVVAQPALWPELFALAELSYLQARRDKSPPEFLAAAIYAYAFIDPGGGAESRPSPYEKQFRQACDIYNLSLAWALTPPDQGAVPIAAATRVLPFGTMALSLNPQDLDWRGGRLIAFQSTANLQVNGINNIYSSGGFGAPLAAEVGPQPAGQALLIPLELRVPANLLLTIDDPRRQIAETALSGRLSIHTIYDTRAIDIGQDSIALSYDQSATMALSLAPAPSRLQGLLDFLNSQDRRADGRLVALEPHRPGYMPVILIHGTTSSAVTWAEMVNDLQEIPAIRRHYEFWFFSYSSANPIPYSALQLRQAIAAAQTQLGGPQADPALGRITLIGHSQGGLLAKMLVIDPGAKLWDGMQLPPIASMTMSAKTRALARAALFPTPVPQVRRVIFISTPQHGSFVAGFSLAKFVGNLIKLPLEVTQAGAEIFGGDGDHVSTAQLNFRMGSIQGMSPNSPFIRALAAIPIAPGVHAHSIISVNTAGPVAQGDDGVVSYASAHVTGVDSELVVRSSHSSQDDFATIAEVERILLLQANQ